MINSGLSWDKITKMINESKKTGEVLANMIYKTEWEQNEVIVLLSDPEHEDLEADLIPVQINFTISAFQNAKLYYENKKKNFIKEKKTVEASHQALKIAEKNAMQEINKNKERTDVLNARKTNWFEKFYWFISSENYLVLSGRDGQQNELLVKKYLHKGDIYLHADYHGASSTIVKNPNKNDPIPTTTLEEAAIYAAARSKAWENKVFLKFKFFQICHKKFRFYQGLGGFMIIKFQRVHRVENICHQGVL
jgi:predicted ribosome quality control (RQC) complex YloA/Tae2 family protein